MKIKRCTGITLVALVVTIVILIILATVSISLVLKSNLVGRATIGAQEYERAQNEEALELRKSH